MDWLDLDLYTIGLWSTSPEVKRSCVRQNVMGLIPGSGVMNTHCRGVHYKNEIDV